MELIRNILAITFRYILYPSVILGLLCYICVIIIDIIQSTDDENGQLRRVTGAILPLIILIFIYTMNRDVINVLGYRIRNFSPKSQFFLGVIIGFSFMGIGKAIVRKNKDGLASLYAFFLSSLGAFLLLIIMGGLLGAINIILLGLILGGGFHIILIGAPDFSSY